MTKADKNNEYKRGLWTEEEDKILMEYIRVHGRRHWNRIPKVTGLMRNGKSCRLRWLNYLSPNVKHGSFSQEEDDLIIRLHNLLGNRWSLIAGRVPGRTDNQVKNHWNTHLCKQLGISKQQTGKVRERVPSKPRASSEMEMEVTQNLDMTLSFMPSVHDDALILSAEAEEKEAEIIFQGQGSSSLNNNNSVGSVKANNIIDEAQQDNWHARGSEIKEHFSDQTFLSEYDGVHNFFLHSPPRLMELFDGFDVI